MSTTISILVNESPIDELSPTKDLKQGNPLASFLFLIVAERLAGLARQTTKLYVLQYIMVVSNTTEINLLQFVDDTLFHM